MKIFIEINETTERATLYLQGDPLKLCTALYSLMCDDSLNAQLLRKIVLVAAETYNNDAADGGAIEPTL